MNNFVARLRPWNMGQRLVDIGTSSYPRTDNTANVKFTSVYTSCAATSGDSRNTYIRHYISGAGGGGECLRAFTTVNNVAAATAHGAHISLSFGTTGSLTGLGVAMRATLHIANQAYTGLGGTYAAIQAELWADGATSDPAGMTQLSLIRCVLGGNATGIADLDDDAYLLTLTGGTIGAGNMVVASTTEANYSHAAKCHINGTEMWMMFASASG